MSFSSAVSGFSHSRCCFLSSGGEIRVTMRRRERERERERTFGQEVIFFAFRLGQEAVQVGMFLLAVCAHLDAKDELHLFVQVARRAVHASRVLVGIERHRCKGTHTTKSTFFFVFSPRLLFVSESIQGKGSVYLNPSVDLALSRSRVVSTSSLPGAASRASVAGRPRRRLRARTLRASFSTSRGRTRHSCQSCS